MRTPALLASLLFLGLFGACGGGGSSSPPTDGGSRDSGRSDLGSGSDGGGADGGSGSDLGPASDGAAMDADFDAAGTDGGAPSDGAVDMPPVSMPCTPMGVCDPFDAASCGTGMTCLPVSTGGNACSMLASTVHLRGEACTGSNTCEAGTMCLDFGTGLQCHALCPMGSIGACGTGEDRCWGTISGSGDACVQICLPRAPPCDIYAQDCADTTLACSFATDPETRAPYTGCRPAGTQTDGQPCGAVTGGMSLYCARGLVCISEGGGAATCHSVCGPDAGAPTCPSGQSCTGLARRWGVGYCRAP